MRFFFTILFQIAILFSYAQNPIGAWEMITQNDDGSEMRMVVVFSESHQVATWFDNASGAFIGTNGGAWSVAGNTMTELVEFDSRDSSRVGTSVSFDFEGDNDKMRIVGTDVWLKRIDDGTPGELNGAWLMSGRKRNGEIQDRDTSRPRKTMKILSGTRFQWIAYNTATKEFKGTGGGTYTTIDGKYTENIEFFSKDDSRVGASLEFDYELKNESWHHSGFSSKGTALYEIWSLRR
ncbi:MAG: membrane or secreted protein [Ekhidna sp.]